MKYNLGFFTLLSVIILFCKLEACLLYRFVRLKKEKRLQKVF